MVQNWSLALDQDKLKALGLSTQAVQQTLYTELTGMKAAELYEGDRTVELDTAMGNFVGASPSGITSRFFLSLQLGIFSPGVNPRSACTTSFSPS